MRTDHIKAVLQAPKRAVIPKHQGTWSGTNREYDYSDSFTAVLRQSTYDGNCDLEKPDVTGQGQLFGHYLPLATVRCMLTLLKGVHQQVDFLVSISH